MADTTNNIREYNREQWTLADIREIVSDTSNVADWPDATPVFLTAPQPKNRAGTIEVAKAE